MLLLTDLEVEAQLSQLRRLQTGGAAHRGRRDAARDQGPPLRRRLRQALLSHEQAHQGAQGPPQQDHRV